MSCACSVTCHISHLSSEILESFLHCIACDGAANRDDEPAFTSEGHGPQDGLAAVPTAALGPPRPTTAPRAGFQPRPESIMDVGNLAAMSDE